jgi:hypothetical protein
MAAGLIGMRIAHPAEVTVAVRHSGKHSAGEGVSEASEGLPCECSTHPAPVLRARLRDFPDCVLILRQRTMVMDDERLEIIRELRTLRTQLSRTRSTANHARIQAHHLIALARAVSGVVRGIDQSTRLEPPREEVAVSALVQISCEVDPAPQTNRAPHTYEAPPVK